VKPRATPKLLVLISLAAAALWLGAITGQPELVVLATPLIVAVVHGCAHSELVEVATEVTLPHQRVLEGDAPTVVLTLDSATRCEVEVGVGVPAGVERMRGRTNLVAVDADEPKVVAVELRATRWGAKRIGPVVERIYGAGRLLVYERVRVEPLMLKVYPAPERLRRSVPPTRTEAFSGDYVSRVTGDGIEFATVKPFATGDTVRRVNWRVTSRRDALHVNLSHPERDTNLILFLDTFADVGLRSGSVLDLTVRGATAVAQHHLRHNDRVGIVSFGGMLRWLTASMGRSHALRIADFLLDVNATFSYAWKDIDKLPTKTLPPSALIVAFSPLVDNRALGALTDIAARGFSIVVVNTLPEDEIDPGSGREAELAHRAWRLQREMTRARLTAAGVPVVTLKPGTGIEAALASAPRRARRRGARMSEARP
jgi:uncharacterized protein (DUF58 family)